MGRYTTVQSYTDNNPNMRAVSYEQAKGGSDSNTAATAKAPKPEKVFNPYGSTAGAGSSEFHVYRHARTREMMRMSKLDEEENEKKLEEEYQNKVNGWKLEEKKRTERKRKKRQRAKQAKERKKNMKLAGVNIEGDSPAAIEEEEFEYIPLAKQNNLEKEIASGKNLADAPKVSFANDGSFLAMMKQRLESERLATEEKKEGDSSKDKTESVKNEVVASK